MLSAGRATRSAEIAEGLAAATPDPPAFSMSHCRDFGRVLPWRMLPTQKANIGLLAGVVAMVMCLVLAYVAWAAQPDSWYCPRQQVARGNTCWAERPSGEIAMDFSSEKIRDQGPARIGSAVGLVTLGVILLVAGTVYSRKQRTHADSLRAEPDVG